MIGPLGQRHRVVVLERPWATVAEQVRATLDDMDAKGLERAVLVGHSAGAEVALAVAHTAQQRVRGLALLAPVVGRGAPAIAGAIARVPGAARVAAPALRAGLRFLGPVLRSTWHDRAGVTPEVVAGYREPLARPGVAEALWAMTAAREDRSALVAALPSIDVPALVIVGSSDRWATPLPLPHARTLVFERCGHLPHEEQPVRTVEAMLEFLDAL